MEPEFDSHGYPTEETLERIRSWPHGSWTELMQYAAAAWKWEFFKNRPPSFYPAGQDELDGRWWVCVTGGWSGNEDIIEALRANTLFWAMCARAWIAGGLYEFHVPPGA